MNLVLTNPLFGFLWEDRETDGHLDAHKHGLLSLTFWNAKLSK